MTEAATIGHNNPPDPIDEITAQYDAARSEAENWADGTPVENEAQMKAVDALRKSMREWRLSLEAGQKSATAPLYDVYKAELARWKPTIDDAKRIETCLVALVDTFKRKLAEEKEAARKKAEAEAWEATRKAQEAARAADTANLEAQREAAAAMAEAERKQREAQAAAKDTVKGLRTVQKYEITDHRAALHWIAKNDRDAMTAFVEEYVRRNFKQTAIDGVTVTTTKEAF
jgi:hypothetical protein